MNDAYRYIPFSKGSDVKTYIFAVSLEPDEEGWRAFYSPLEHVGASTWGATEDEALKHIQEVLSMIVEEFAEEGRDLPSSQGLLVTGGAAVAVTK
jgi:predicted RNase H-like HicB family nuclease